MPSHPVRSTLVLVSALALSACAITGDRALGGCPVGETCSTQAPNGLFFVGSPTADNVFGGGLAPVAPGGTLTVTALTGQNSGSPPFAATFDAKSADTTIFQVSGVNPPSVTVRGGAQGAAFLRLVDTGTNNLLDRVTVEVQPVGSASVYPRDLVLLLDNPDTTPWAMLAGAPAPLVVRLRAVGAPNRIVDESLALTSTSGSPTRKAWDLFEIAAPAGDASFTITSGKASFAAKAQVVKAIDAITQSTSLGSAPPSTLLAIGADTLFCFVARSAGVATSGVTWSFQVDSGVEIPADVNQGLDLPSCVTVRGKTAGAATLTVVAGALTEKVALTVDAKKARSGALLRGPVGPTPVAGERAGGDDGS